MPTQAPTKRITISWPALHPGQRKVEQSWQRYNVLAAGRRWGKTKYSQFKLVEPCMKKLPTAYFCPTYKLLSDAWRELKSRLEPILVSCNTTERRMELMGGGSIDWWTLEDEDAGRGRKYARVVVDEAGLVPKLGDIWHNAIRPTLADYAGDALICGTPKGRNFFHHCFTLGMEGASNWVAHRMPTSTNPHIRSEEIEEMRRTMTERAFSQEVMAEFLEDGGQVFRKIADAVDDGCLQPYDASRQYYAGLDLGKSEDWTVLTIMDGDRTVRHIDRYNGMTWTLQKGRIAAKLREYGNPPCYIDSTGLGDPIFDDLSTAGIDVYSYKLNNSTKEQAIEGLIIAFEQGEITIPNDPTLITELEAFGAEVLPSGRTRYSAPEGYHDDMVCSLYLANAMTRLHVYDEYLTPLQRQQAALGVPIQPVGAENKAIREQREWLERRQREESQWEMSIEEEAY